MVPCRPGFHADPVHWSWHLAAGCRSRGHLSPADIRLVGSAFCRAANPALVLFPAGRRLLLQALMQVGLLLAALPSASIHKSISEWLLPKSPATFSWCQTAGKYLWHGKQNPQAIPRPPQTSLVQMSCCCRLCWSFQKTCYCSSCDCAE